MATITSNATGGGLWSAGTTWAGGVAPVDNDTVVIAAGDTVTLDVDMSGYANGIAGVTVTGGATPGMIVFRFDADGTYCLKIKAATTLSGTLAGGNNGRLLANSDGVWGNTGALPFGRKAIISLVTTASIAAANLDMRMYCVNPTIPYVEVWGTVFSVTWAADDKLTFVSPSTTPPQAGTPITVSGTIPGELVAGTTYFIRDVSGSTCKLEATIGGGVIDLTGSGTMNLHYGRWGPVAQATAVNTTTGLITWNGVPPAANTAVIVRSTGTLPTGLTEGDLYYVRGISGNGCKLSLRADDVQIVIPSAVGTGNISMYMGGTATTTAVVNVIQDVSADAPWVTTDDEDRCVLADIGPVGWDHQRVGLVAINGGTIQLSANVNSAQYPGARLYLVSRNCSIRSSCATAVNIVNGGANCVLGEIRSTAGTGTTFYGYGLNAGTNHTVTTISGCTYGTNAGTGHAVTIIAGCSSGVYGGTGCTVTAIAGCVYGTNTGTGHVATTIAGCNIGISGTSHTATEVLGCNLGISVGTGCTATTISGCGTGISGSIGCAATTISGATTGISVGTGCTATTLLGCAFGISGGVGCTATTISLCTTGVSVSAGTMRGTTFSGNTTDISNSVILGYGCALQSATQVADYCVAIYDIANGSTPPVIQAGRVRAWTPGGTVASEESGGGTFPASPPVALNFAHKHTFASASAPCWFDVPLRGAGGVKLTVYVYIKANQTPSGMTAGPRCQIVDPNLPWGTPAALLADTAIADNTNWQTITLEYTPTYDRELTLRVRATNASGYMHWMFAVPTEGGPAGGLLLHPGMTGGMRG